VSNLRPLGAAHNRTIWGHKAQRTLSLSNDVWVLITTLAEESGMARSEVLEVVFRHLASQSLDLLSIRNDLLR